MPSALSGVVNAQLTAKRIPCEGISDETEAHITSSTKPSNSITSERNKSQRHAPAYLPFQPSWHYPSTFERTTYKLLIGAANRLWPVPPLYFGVSIVVAAAYHMGLQTNAFLFLFPHASSLWLRILRVGVVSLFFAHNDVDHQSTSLIEVVSKSPPSDRSSVPTRSLILINYR
uniref:Pecanex-like protein n=1 Tax=Ascaris lumbricoides TaxID=6252 RepID=A0A0M3HHK4_ASCLU